MPVLENTHTQEAGLGQPTTLEVRAASLEVVSGPDTGRSARLDQPLFVIGSGETADLRLGDGTVSREHVHLSLSVAGLHVRDQGSKNGTWLGSVRVSEALLTADATLSLGSTTIAVRIEAASLGLPLSARQSFGAAIGVSAPMRHLFSILERAAPSDATVLLEGESGVGKEVLARAVHEHSLRATGPFVTVDCGAIPAGLVEAELFGHERGAFTGAVDARVGMFEQADGGTLFLDEIGELPLDLQPKLLRVLEMHAVHPVGGKGDRPVDVRIVAATNRRLMEAARRGEFRQDLFYRLAVVRATIPPLRDRPEDVLPIASMMLRRVARDPRVEIPPDLAAMLRSYSWPGNVRELRNVIERYNLFGARTAATLFDGAPEIPEDETWASLPYGDARRAALERFEERYFPAVLERAGGVVSRAAEHAKVARPSFYRMLERVRARRATG
ncbi:MAG: sigma 54-dependent Fis family transcriptional regulator [Myxococcales bacterium]|nr:sigma 54-dependent Fis family transcriptional regulator [Myxococcales bacterium]